MSDPGPTTRNKGQVQMQRVNFPSYPKVEGDKFIATTLEIYRKVQREEVTDKQLKRWMRTQGWYDKETFDDLLEFIGVEEHGRNKEVTLKGVALELLEESNAEKRQDLLFARVAQMNEILVKYVFDAIQERLYSTNELFRMLTSYVYPGSPIGMADFTSWLKWVQATQRIRVLGIRWALGSRFSASQLYVQSIDVDELLEEEAEEDLLDDEEDEVEATPAPVATAAPAPAPAEPVQPTASSGWEPPEVDAAPEDEEDDEEDDSGRYEPPPMAAPPVSASGGAADMGLLVAALTQALQGGAKEEEADATRIEPRLLKPIEHLSTLAAGVPLERVRAAMAGDEANPDEWLESLEPSESVMAENVRLLMEWWASVEKRPLVRADQHGLTPTGDEGWVDGGRAKFLFRLSCLGVALLRGGKGGPAGFSVLDRMGFYERLFDEPGSVERLMDEMFEMGLGARRDLFAQLHITLMLARSLRGAEAWCEGLAELDAEEALEQLWRRLAAYSLDLEVIWIARELSMFGLLGQDELQDLRVVPTEEARRAAYHLGLLESPQARSLSNLVYASRRLTTLTGSLEGPLVAFWRSYGAHPPRRFWSR